MNPTEPVRVNPAYDGPRFDKLWGSWFGGGDGERMNIGEIVKTAMCDV